MLGVPLAPTPREVVLEDGPARLYRFHDGTHRRSGRTPLLLVPSLINRWYIVDLRKGVSLASSLLSRGFDVFCLDWGAPRDEDRYFGWDDVCARLARAARRVQRRTGASKVALLGYCMGGTLAGIHAALEPDSVAALIDLAGPFDFSAGGHLTRLCDRRWFDPETIAAAGNISPGQMQSGFQLLRPTLSIGKWVGFFDRFHDPAAREAFFALETWANDNIAFPAKAWATYVRELYQENRLVRGDHLARGRRVDLGKITCPVLTIATEKDTICPPAAARALHDLCGSKDKEWLLVPGGHVGAVIGSRAPTHLYPAIADWLEKRV